MKLLPLRDHCGTATKLLPLRDRHPANYRYICLLAVVVTNDDHRIVLLQTSILLVGTMTKMLPLRNHCGAAMKLLPLRDRLPCHIQERTVNLSWKCLFEKCLRG